MCFVFVFVFPLVAEHSVSHDEIQSLQLLYCFIFQNKVPVFSTVPASLTEPQEEAAGSATE